MNSSKAKLIASMLIFGSIGLFVRNIDLSSSQIALGRGIIGSLFLILASLILKRKISWKAIRPNLLFLILSGAAIGFNWILLFEAYKYTTIPNATLSYYFAPVLVLFLSPVFLKERLTVTKTICILAAIIGMLCIVGIGKGNGSNHLIGIGFGLMAAVFYAGVIIMNKFLKGLTGIETTVIQLGSASIILLPYVLMTEKVDIARFDTRTLLLLTFVGIVNTGLAYLLYFISMKNISGQTIAVYSYIDPISAIIMSSIFLGDRMSALQIIGGVLILGATFISERYGQKQIS